ncbi:hypothetical protein JHW43_000816 [Diplocarpon mali]|nr:hypothetical protein JHW43_000816 [Diplocarpon mali]
MWLSLFIHPPHTRLLGGTVLAAHEMHGGGEPEKRADGEGLVRINVSGKCCRGHYHVRERIRASRIQTRRRVQPSFLEGNCRWWRDCRENADMFRGSCSWSSRVPAAEHTDVYSAPGRAFTAARQLPEPTAGQRPERRVGELERRLRAAHGAEMEEFQEAQKNRKNRKNRLCQQHNERRFTRTDGPLGVDVAETSTPAPLRAFSGRHPPSASDPRHPPGPRCVRLSSSAASPLDASHGVVGKPDPATTPPAQCPPPRPPSPRATSAPKRPRTWRLCCKRTAADGLYSRVGKACSAASSSRLSRRPGCVSRSLPRFHSSSYAIPALCTVCVLGRRLPAVGRLGISLRGMGARGRAAEADGEAWQEFMTLVATECAAKKHHPEWSNLYNTTFIRWTTHSPPGLSEKDVLMARFCDEKAAECGELEAEAGGEGEEGGREEELVERVVAEGGDCCMPKNRVVP